MKTKRDAKAKQPKAAPPVPANIEAVVSRADIAAALRISIRQVDVMIAKGEYPRPDGRVGKLPRWKRATHDRWMLEHFGGEA